MVVIQDLSLHKRFWSKVDSEDWANGCWVWIGAVDPAGYGRFSDLKRDSARLAHQWSWYFAGGDKLTKGFELDHVCLNRSCVRPDHLRITTKKQQRENLAGAQRNNRSKVRGVHAYSDGKRFRVRVKHDGCEYNGGTYGTIKEAEHAAIALRRKLFTHNERDKGFR